ncbi:hypothetical protein HAX54_000098 [Datura stramonium]|uniref:Uncharacterized protein n=1 Tax=Datura stramonium TaxID=4076 RepID=A0ABS8RHJ1_DATST|nr:hypothetical protein [Datura stramonium]
MIDGYLKFSCHTPAPIEMLRFSGDSDPAVWVFQAEQYFNFHGFSKDLYIRALGYRPSYCRFREHFPGCSSQVWPSPLQVPSLLPYMLCGGVVPTVLNAIETTISCHINKAPIISGQRVNSIVLDPNLEDKVLLRTGVLL